VGLGGGPTELHGTVLLQPLHAGVVSTAGGYVESTWFFGRVTEHLVVTASCAPRGQCGATRSRCPDMASDLRGPNGVRTRVSTVLKVLLKVKPGIGEGYDWVECNACEYDLANFALRRERQVTTRPFPGLVSSHLSSANPCRSERS
jgi:hypothetical protein